MTYHLDERKSFWTRKKLSKGHKVFSWWHGTLWEGRVDHFGKRHPHQGQRVFILVTKPAPHQPVHEEVAVG